MSLHLPGVFWKSPDDEHPEDAIVTVEDGEVCYITSSEGFEVRLLIHEVVALAKFVAEEVERFDDASAETLETDGVPF